MSIPEGATHKAVGPRIDCWYRNISSVGFEFMNQGGTYWVSKIGTPAWELEPIYQPKPWSGPEDGLPPVGTVCELTEAVLLADEDRADWFEAGTQVDVGGHVMFNGATSSVCAICVVGDNFTGTLSASCLRPIQPALDARETAIRELMDIAQVDCRVTAARLVDAGFKREAV